MAGRDAAIRTHDEPAQCHLRGKHVPESPGVDEVVRIIVVNGAKAVDAVCADAKAFAGVLFPLLPPAA
ncbi:hypothetical protein [Actinokineospora sp. NPDC004072]